MSSARIDLIRQALSAAESSIRLARQLLNELEKEDVKGRGQGHVKDIPGITGIFDGQGMVTEKGEKYAVPENYASKSILVVGDTLKLVEEGGDKRFKQVEHLKRHKTSGILTKKDGKWSTVTSEGSYRVLPASVAHFEGDVGDEVLLQLPASNLQVPWGAVEKITKKGSKEVRAEKKEPKIEAKEKKQPEIKEEKEKVEEPKLEAKKETKPEENPVTVQEEKREEKQSQPEGLAEDELR